MKALMCLMSMVALAAGIVAQTSAADGGPGPGISWGWDGVRSPSSAVRYVALPGGATTTTLAAVRVRDGRVLRFTTIPGVVGIPLVAFDGATEGLSADRRTIVLVSNAGAAGRGNRTDIVVVRTRTMTPLRTIRLPGTWSFDALAPNGATIFAIQYRTNAPQPSYRVRAIDVATGRIKPGSIVDRSEPDGVMRGSPVTRVWAAELAYTLYARPNGTAFLHALDTRNATARCIDLPWTKTGNGIWRVRLAVANGQLRLRQKGAGTLAGVDLRSFNIRQFRQPLKT